MLSKRQVPEVMMRIDQRPGIDHHGAVLSICKFAGAEQPQHVCDRVAVFRQGRIAAVLGHAQLSEEAIVAASVGLSDSAPESAAL